MKLLRVLLINSGTQQKEILHQKLSSNSSIKLAITDAGVKNAETIFNESKTHLDVVLFSDKMPASVILKLAKIFRGFDTIIPIFILSKQSEAQVPRRYRQAGIDDVLNIAEIDTPLFSWTFMSAVEHAILKKKAREYDCIYKRLRHTNESLANLMHEINNPLSVIRLTMYHLEDPAIPREKKEMFFKLLVSSLEKIDIYMKELRAIRRQLNGEKAASAKILSINPALNLSAIK
jgi:signal transduction histidine kinase